jgi:hypothetical protein
MGLQAGTARVRTTYNVLWTDTLAVLVACSRKPQNDYCSTHVYTDMLYYPPDVLDIPHLLGGLQ